MSIIYSKQQGKSPIVTLIILAILGVGIYLGFQYIPIKMEHGKIDTVMDNLQSDHLGAPLTSVKQITDRLTDKLSINDMLDMRDLFTVKQERIGFSVSVMLERELNLIYEKRPIIYERRILLN